MPDTILVVDDDQDIRFVLSLLLSDAGYQVTEARDGKEALEKVDNTQTDLILLDINMPKLNGFDVCQHLKNNSRTAAIPVIFLTAADEVGQKVKGFDIGAADYITKTFNKAELLARVRTQLRIQHLLNELTLANHELRDKQAQLDDDLRSAAAIQRTLLPSTMPDIGGSRIAWNFLPCQMVAGDIFNVLRLDQDHIALYMLDVSGHGVPSAMVTVSVSQLLQPLAETVITSRLRNKLDAKHIPPKQVLEILDTTYPFERFGKYFTIVYLVLNLKTGQLTYSSAGHPPPLFLSKDGHSRQLSAGGPIIGLGNLAEFEEETLPLSPSDRLILYTDGALDRRDSSGLAFGLERFTEAWRQSHKQPMALALNQIAQTLLEFGQGQPLEDDISLLGLEFSPQ